MHVRYYEFLGNDSAGPEIVKLIKLISKDMNFRLESAAKTLKNGIIFHLVIEMHTTQVKSLNQSADDISRLLKNNGYQQQHTTFTTTGLFLINANH